MRAVLQRVTSARVSVGERPVAEIGPGLLILLGVGQGDGESEADALAEKCALLRVFQDAQGKTNLSVREVGGQVLVVSQFTLYADASRGRRPSFAGAAAPATAEALVERFVACLAAMGVPARTGEFGAHMRVELANDGPFTLVLEETPAGT